LIRFLDFIKRDAADLLSGPIYRSSKKQRPEIFTTSILITSSVGDEAELFPWSGVLPTNL
jgi:hypothetical protein